VVEESHAEIIEVKHMCSGTRFKLPYNVIYAIYKVSTHARIA
jgi:hypothetical protein